MEGVRWAVIAAVSIAVTLAALVTRPNDEPRGSVENFKELIDQLRAAKEGTGPKSWTAEDADVYESFTSVNGMPPTEVSMQHYRFIKARDKLDKAGLMDRMQSDIPSTDEYVI